jgi:hypothetical protein
MTYIHIVIFWVITSCSLVCLFRRFGGTYYILRYISTHLPVYTVSNPRTKWPWFSAPWEPQISRSVGSSSAHVWGFLPAPIDGKNESNKTEMAAHNYMWKTGAASSLRSTCKTWTWPQSNRCYFICLNIRSHNRCIRKNILFWRQSNYPIGGN